MTKAKYVKTLQAVTADGRSLVGAVWRTIPEFPLYQITIDGDIRNRDTGTILQECQNTGTGAWFYSLWKDGHRYSRGYEHLLASAWPEVDEEWMDLPGFPLYEIHWNGDIRSKRFRKVLPFYKTSKTVVIRKEGKRYYFDSSKVDMSNHPHYLKDAA